MSTSFNPGDTFVSLYDYAKIYGAVATSGGGGWSYSYPIFFPEGETAELVRINYFYTSYNYEVTYNGQTRYLDPADLGTYYELYVSDTEKPVITLTGDASITLTQGDTYTEQGATWTDNVDGSGDAVVTGSVDTSTVGTYTIAYNYTDAAGNVATEVTRTVDVIAVGPQFSTTYNSGVTLSNNNTTAETSTTTFRRAVSSISASSGKLSLEFTIDKIAAGIFLGITSEENPDSSNVFIGSSSNSHGIYARPNYGYVQEYNPGTGSLGDIPANFNVNVVEGDTIAFTFDADNGKIHYSLNGGAAFEMQGEAVPAGTYYPVIGSGAADKTVIATISEGEDISISTDNSGEIAFSTSYNNGVTLSNNNLTAQTGTSTFRRAVSTKTISSGTYSFDFTVDTIGSGIFLGITSEQNPAATNTFIGASSNSYGIYAQGGLSYVTEYVQSSSSQNSLTQVRSGDTVTFTFDADNGTLDYSVNGGTSYQITGVASGTYYPVIGDGSASSTVTATISEVTVQQPTEICPQLLQKIVASDGSNGDRFGISASIDGTRLAVGAHYDDDAGTDSGSVYIYELQNGAWTQTHKFQGNDTVANDRFGRSVSLDGNQLAVGAHADDDAGTDSGSVYIFELQNNLWVQTHKFRATDTAANDYFGIGVSLEGARLAVGAHDDDDAGTNSGSVYIFELLNGTWTQTHKFQGNDTVAGDRFGRSVSLNGDRLAVGAHPDHETSSESGSAYIFELQNNSWVQIHKFQGNDTAAGDYFGIDVSLLGTRLAVGAHADDDTDANSGSVYIFELLNGTWTQTHKFRATDTVTNDYFGVGVSLDGDHLAVGSLFGDDAGTDSGSVYVYSLSCEPVQPSREDIELLIQSNTTDGNTTFTDLSYNSRSVSVLGDTQHSTTEAYLGSTSMAFDGTGDYLQIGDESTFKFLHDGTTDYTVECWANLSDWGDSSNWGGSDLRSSIIATGGSTTSLGIGLWAGTDGFTFRITSGAQGSPVVNITGGTVNFNTWYHIAVCRNFNTYKLFVNGVLVGESVGGSHSTANSYHALRVGRHSWPNGTLQYDGYIQDVRISKTAVYPGDFTPPTTLSVAVTPPSEPTCEEVVLHIQPSSGDTITDKSGNNHEITVVGDTVVDNTATLFGGGTINFDGNGDYLTVSSSDTLAFGTSDFTIEAWIKSDGSDYFTILQNLPHGNVAQLDDWFFGANTLGVIGFSMHGNNTANRVETGLGVFKFDGQFHHVAFTRTSTGCSIWYDGQQVATSDALNTWNFNKIQDHTIGYRVTPNYSSGAIQDIRISKKAVYTGNFTPPTSLLNFCTFTTPTVIDTGSGYTSPGTDVPTTGGSGTGLKVSYDVNDDGGVKDPTITDDGTGYQDGDVVDIPGGTEPAKVVLTTYTAPPAGTDTNSILFKIGRAIKTAENLSVGLNSVTGSYQDFLNGYGNTIPDGGGTDGTDGTDVQPEVPYVPDPYFDLNNFVDEVGAHHIYFLVPYTNTRTGTAIEHPAGTVFRTTGISQDQTLIRAEDPDNPRDYPYTTHSTNISSGVWSWFNLSNRGTQWEFATTGTPTEAP